MFCQNKNPAWHSHVTVGQAPELLHTERLLLDVVLSEEPRLAGHHLLNGSVDHHIVYVVVGATRLPAFGRDDLSSRESSSLICIVFIISFILIVLII